MIAALSYPCYTCYIYHEKLISIYIKRGGHVKREEFLNQIEGYVFPKLFNQDLLDRAAEMFGRWGKSAHLDETEHLFQSSGLASREEDSNEIREQKAALRYVCSRMMDSGVNRKDAADLIRNFNRLKDPGYKWLD